MLGKHWITQDQKKRLNADGILQKKCYHLVICYIAMVKPWPIEIDGLPNLKMVIFHGELLVITRG